MAALRTHSLHRALRHSQRSSSLCCVRSLGSRGAQRCGLWRRAHAAKSRRESRKVTNHHHELRAGSQLRAFPASTFECRACACRLMASADLLRAHSQDRWTAFAVSQFRYSTIDCEPAAARSRGRLIKRATPVTDSGTRPRARALRLRHRKHQRESKRDTALMSLSAPAWAVRARPRRLPPPRALESAALARLVFARAQSTAVPGASPASSSYAPRKWSRALRLAAWVPIAAFVFSHVVSIGQVKGGSMIVCFHSRALTSAADSHAAHLQPWGSTARDETHGRHCPSESLGDRQPPLSRWRHCALDVGAGGCNASAF